MKKCLVVIFALVLFVKVHGQNDTSLLLNEFSLSVNHTILPGTDISNTRFGFGLGAYRIFRKEKKTNITIGLEFNQTGQFKDHEHDGHFAYATDLTYTFYTISLPLTVRFNVGEKVKFFTENGLFLDLNAVVMRKGTEYLSYPDSNNHLVNKVDKFNERAGMSPLDFGHSFGIGLKIPVSKHNLLIKTDFKCGLWPFLNKHDDQLINWCLQFMVSFQL